MWKLIIKKREKPAKQQSLKRHGGDRRQQIRYEFATKKCNLEYKMKLRKFRLNIRKNCITVKMS